MKSLFVIIFSLAVFTAQAAKAEYQSHCTSVQKDQNSCDNKAIASMGAAVINRIGLPQARAGVTESHYFHGDALVVEYIRNKTTKGICDLVVEYDPTQIDFNVYTSVTHAEELDFALTPFFGINVLQWNRNLIELSYIDGKITQNTLALSGNVQNGLTLKYTEGYQVGIQVKKGTLTCANLKEIPSSQLDLEKFVNGEN